MKLTEQSELWPEYGEINHRYYIKNRLLADCAGYGHSYTQNRLDGISSTAIGPGAALLTYFASCALNIRRFPFCEDRKYIKYLNEIQSRKKLIRILSEISAGAHKLDDIINEARTIYEHTQNKLRERGIERVNLRRVIYEDKFSDDQYRIDYSDKRSGYAQTIMQLKNCAEILGHEKIRFEMDVLNCFGDSKDNYQHLADVSVIHSIKASDVFFCSNLIGYKGEQEHSETQQWIILNREPDGVISIPTSAINYNTKMWENEVINTKEAAESFMELYDPFVLRQDCRYTGPAGSSSMTKTKQYRIKKILNNFYDKIFLK